MGSEISPRGLSRAVLGGAPGQAPREGAAAAGGGRPGCAGAPRPVRQRELSAAAMLTVPSFGYGGKAYELPGTGEKLPRQRSQRKKALFFLFFFFFLSLSPRSLPQFPLKFLSGKVILPFKFRVALWCVCTASSSAVLLQSTALQWYSTEKNTLKEVFSKELGCLVKAAAACVCPPDD